MPTSQRDTQEERSTAVLVLVLIVIAILLVLVRFYLHIQIDQMLRLVAILFALLLTPVVSIWHKTTLKRRIDAMSPHRTPYLSLRRHMEYRAKASQFEKSAVFLGQDSHGNPIYWTRDSRVRQTIVVGSSGSGKTSFFEHIAQQDIKQGLPLIYVDGKGDMELFDRVLQSATESGRAGDVRLISRVHSGLSSIFNPLFCTPDELEEHIGFLFNSFLENGNPFFSGEQFQFLSDCSRVLHATGKIVTMSDVLVCARQPQTLRMVMEIAHREVASKPLSDARKRTFNASMNGLRDYLNKEDRLYNVLHMLNQMAHFLTPDMFQITSGKGPQIIFKDVIDKRQILFVTLNINSRAAAMQALGRMILSTLQYVLGNRFEQSSTGTRYPFTSVMLDEFTPYAIDNFSHILQTARAGRVAIMMGIQSVSQFSKVSTTFQKEMSYTANNKIIMQISDKETSEMVTEASAHVHRPRDSYHVRRSLLFPNRVREEMTGIRKEERETVISDKELKYQPRGQAETLFSNDKVGQIRRHLHFPRPFSPLLTHVPSDMKGENEAFGGVIRGLPGALYPPDILDDETPRERLDLHFDSYDLGSINLQEEKRRRRNA